MHAPFIDPSPAGAPHRILILFFAEHVSAVTVAVKDKMNLSIGVAVGSSIVSLLALPPFKPVKLSNLFSPSKSGSLLSREWTQYFSL